MRRAFPCALVLAGVGLALTAVIALGVAGAWYPTRDSSPVGHFHSPEGRRAYEASYAAAMERLPPPSRSLHVGTSFGTVRGP